MSDVTPMGWRISVVFEDRPDGGLRVYSDDVPGFILSHSDPKLVMEDVEPALRIMIAEQVGKPVQVSVMEAKEGLGFAGNRRRTRDYQATLAA